MLRALMRGGGERAMATKDFGQIEDDYAFFMSNSTESESDVEEYLRQLDENVVSNESLHLFDFGCGTGEFTHLLLEKLNLPREQLRLSLLEPVTHQRDDAVRRLAAFSSQPIDAYSTPESAPSASFDVVVANHVLYYVEDLHNTLEKLLRLLRPGGRLLTAIAGKKNVLIQFWQVGFELLGRPIPYYVSEDVEATLLEKGIRFQKSQAPYQLRFPDTVENRSRILRFLFGEFLIEISQERLLTLFDPYVDGDHIQIVTESDHYSIVPGDWRN